MVNRWKSVDLCMKYLKKVVYTQIESFESLKCTPCQGHGANFLYPNYHAIIESGLIPVII